MDSIEVRLGYKFRNPLLLAEALTHPSLAYESQKAHFDNQRLEFLGDAVLQLALTEHLFRMFPDFPEGRMTKLRAQLVSRQALAQFASSLELGKYLLLGKGEEASGGRKRSSTLADAFEALVGAIYLDSGYTSARDLVLHLFEQEIGTISENPEDASHRYGGSEISHHWRERARSSQSFSCSSVVARSDLGTRSRQEQKRSGSSSRH
jgi:ribonuclease-3